jgi:hypothetical protein
MSSENSAHSTCGKIMLVGLDSHHILEKRLQAAGWQVVKVDGEEAALERARHEVFDKAVMVSKGSLINVAEAIFNLRDLNRGIEIIVLVDRIGKQSSRFLRQLLEHPIEGTQIMTRRQLQRQLHGTAGPPGAAF